MVVHPLHNLNLAKNRVISRACFEADTFTLDMTASKWELVNKCSGSHSDIYLKFIILRITLINERKKWKEHHDLGAKFMTGVHFSLVLIARYLIVKPTFGTVGTQ